MAFYMDQKDERKKQYVACRMDLELFSSLKQEADRRGVDLSNCIRALCSEALK